MAPYARGCGPAQSGAASGACSINVACGGGGGPVVVTGMGSQSPSQPARRRRMVRGSSPSIQQVIHSYMVFHLVGNLCLVDIDFRSSLDLYYKYPMPWQGMSHLKSI